MVVVHGIQQGSDVIDGRGSVDPPPIVLRDDVFEPVLKGRILAMLGIAVLAMAVTVHDGPNLTHRRSRGDGSILVLKHDKGDRARKRVSIAVGVTSARGVKPFRDDHKKSRGEQESGGDRGRDAHAAVASADVQ